MTLDNKLTPEELAARLGVKPRTLRLWRAERGLPFVKIGRLVLFDAMAVEAWLDRHEGKGPVAKPEQQTTGQNAGGKKWAE